MSSRREQVWVGIFVLVAAGIVLGVVLSVSGAFSSKGTTFLAYFKYAAGLTPGAPVRYGGLMAGKIETLGVDPEDSTRIRIVFRVGQDIPVKSDSLVKITSLGALGESYLEITTGTKAATPAAPGSVLTSREPMAFADIGDQVAGVVPTANHVLKSLDDRLGEIKITIAHVNDLLGDKNRQNVSTSLATLNAMLAETRPKITATLAAVQEASERLPEVSKNVLASSERVGPLLDDLKGTVKQANEALAHIDGILVENRPDIRATMLDIRKTMDTASKAVELMRVTLDRNGDNLDESLANVRAATDNLKDLTDTVKRKPSVLIRGETGKDRQPGATK